VQTVPTHGRPSGVLVAESCPGPDVCTGVGYSIDAASGYTPLIESWNGTTWTIDISPVPAGATSARLDGVSCVAGATCAAVGRYTKASGVVKPLAESISGGSWTVETTALPSGATAGALTAVSCTSGACQGVGSYVTGSGVTDTLGESSSGGGWTVVSTVTPTAGDTSQLDGISCTGADSCMAVGSSTNPATTNKGPSPTKTIAESWDGKTWTIDSMTAPPGGSDPDDVLTGVSCTTASTCVAVGYRSNQDASFVTLGESWNGSAWAIDTTQDPSGASSSVLNAVSCGAGSDTCDAVGGLENPSGTSSTLAESWDGSKWTLQQTPAPANGSGDLDGVSCDGGDACHAVGAQTDGASDSTALAESYDGTSWAVDTSADPAGDPVNKLEGVSCTSTSSCVTVGQGADASSDSRTLSETWDGKTWATTTTQDPSGAASSQLDGVSCSAPTSCDAVGGYIAGDPVAPQPLAETMSGDRWTTESTPLPVGASGGTLTAVSCPVDQACVAVGSFENGSGVTKSLAETSSGGSWTISATPQSAGVSTQLDGISCTSAADCTAVGSSTDSTGNALPSVETFDGNTWSVTAGVPVPSKSIGASLQSVSCSSGSACRAAGWYTMYGGGTDPVAGRLPFAEAWDGTTWTLQTTPLPAGAVDAELEEVSCTSSTACTAAGDSTDANGDVQSLVESSAGSTWSTQASGGPAGTTMSQFGGISCPITADCTAVGSYAGDAPLSSQALVEVG
jgi:hypothetical protein